MKNLTILFLMLVSVAISAQENKLVENHYPTEDGMIKYTEVVHVDSSLTQTDLYLNAKKWVVDTFGSGKAVTQVDNEDAGIIIIKGFVEKGHNAMISNPKNWFTLKIELKDGRYKYTMYDIRYEFDVSVMGQHEHHEKVFEDWMKMPDQPMSKRKEEKVYNKLAEYCVELDQEFKNILSSLRKAMETKEESDW